MQNTVGTTMVAAAGAVLTTAVMGMTDIAVLFERLSRQLQELQALP
ncbi:MAG: hypothetical protein GXX79_07210 [Actinomycetales bacterium]|nr:hypothetical protein [Actinomycetales bacterium]